MTHFLFGQSNVVEIIGWHVALLIVFVTGLWLGHKLHRW